MPRFSGCAAGNAPSPSNVSATGMPARSANSRTSVHRAGNDDAVPRENHRALGVVNQFQRLLVFLRLGRQIRTVSRQLRLGGFPIEFASGLLRIFRDVDQHRPGTSRARNIKRFANGSRHFAGMGHQIIVLGDRKSDAGDVRFLKRVGADQLASHLSGNADDRRRIEHGRGNSGDHVGGARARSGDGDSNLPAGSRVAVGHVRGALLVTHQNVMNLAVLERVVGRQNGAAGIAEDDLHALTLQAFPKNAGARSCSFPICLVHHGPVLALLKSKTHRASVSGGAGFGSL